MEKPINSILPAPTSPKETLVVAGSYHEELQTKLNVNAVEKVRKTLSKTSTRLENYKPEVVPEAIDGLMRDDSFNLRSLVELREAGLLEAVSSVETGKREKLTEHGVEVEVERIDSKQFGLNFGEGQDFSNIRASIREKIKSSSVAKLFREAVQEIKIGNSSELSNSTLKLSEDPLISAEALRQLNLFGFHQPVFDYGPLMDPDTIAASKLDQVFKNKATITDEGKISQVGFEIDETVKVILEPVEQPSKEDSLLDTEWKMRIVTDFLPNTMERANQSPRSKSENFINRPTGKALIDALEHSKLRFSEDFEDFIIKGASREFDDRYGVAYSQLSRQLAKIVHSGKLEKLNRVFASTTQEPIASSQLQEFIEFQSSDNGLKTFQEILKQLMARGSDRVDDRASATESKISITKSACFDVVHYYAEAQELGDLHNTTIFGFDLLEKTHGAETFINIKPLVFRGIVLPKGSLFVRGEDEKLAFLRFTAFMFDSREDMVSSFGTEIIKAERNGGNIQAVVSRMKNS